MMFETSEQHALTRLKCAACKRYYWWAIKPGVTEPYYCDDCSAKDVPPTEGEK